MFTPAKQQTDLHTAFGQYLAHDLAHSAPKACPIEAWPIPNPKDTDIQKTIPFQRSKHSSEGPNQPREQFSAVSAFIDGSAIYGTNEAFTDKLRGDGLCCNCYFHSPDQDCKQGDKDYVYRLHGGPSSSQGASPRAGGAASNLATWFCKIGIHETDVSTIAQEVNKPEV